MNRRLPIIFVLLVGIMTCYVFTDYYLQKKYFVKNFAEIVLIKERNLANYTELGRAFGSVGMWNEAYDRLEDARFKNYIDFFVLQHVPNDKTRKTVFYGSPDGNPNAFEMDFGNVDKVIQNKESTYTTIQVGDYRLTVGILKKLDHYLDVQMAQLRDDIIEETIYFAFIVFFVGLWVFRDFFAILRKVRKGQVKDLANVKTHSSESDAFLRGLIGFNDQVEGLQSENALYQRQVLPSLKKEIFSGKKPPYDFLCTLVRTDINNFSVIYNTHDVETFMRIINEFFVEVTHVVSRYKGLVHEFVGDEVIFYFKDEEHPNSFMIALSAVRDIGMVAEKFNARTLKENGYPFTVKSSLAHGKVRFGPLVNGFGIAGSVLIETVRILAHVLEKDGNVVYFDKQRLDSVQKNARTEEATRVKLKGFSEEKTLVRYLGHVSLGHLLSHLDLATSSHLGYYRSDDDLVRVINHLKSQMSEYGERLLLLSIQNLRTFTVTKSDPRVTIALKSWIRDLSQAIERDGAGGKSAKVLSSVVASLTSLIPAHALPQEMVVEVEALLKCPDKRVVANAVEVLSHFENANRTSLLKRIGRETNDRVLANTLIHDAKSELSSGVLRRLRKQLDSKSGPSLASGLFALGEIALYYRLKDPVQFATQHELKELIRRIPKFAVHEEPSVYRQAVLAAEKADDKTVQTQLASAIQGKQAA